MSTKKTEPSNQIPHRITELQKMLDDFYEKPEGKQRKGGYISQVELSDYLHMTQPGLSRMLKGFEIDWESGKITKKVSPNDLITLTKGVTIVKPSVFFLTVPRSRRKALKDALLKIFPSKKDAYGIINIIENTAPSGLLIFSDDHNLEYKLMNNDYLLKTASELDQCQNNQEM